MSLAANAKQAVLWNAGFNILSMGMQFITTTILARLLPQQAYGHLGFVTDLYGFISIFAMTNFITYTLQVKNDDEVHWQDQFTAATVLNLSMWVLMNVIGLVLWWLPNWREVAPYVHVMSLLFLLSLPTLFQSKRMERRFDFKNMRILHAIGILLSTVTAITMAKLGYGTYALLVPGFCACLPFVYQLLVLEGFRPTWQWSWQNFKPAFWFGLSRMGSGIAFYGRQILVSGVLSATLGFAALGVMNRSIGLAQMFCVQVSSLVLTALYPILTRVSDADGNPARVGGLVLQTISWIAIPIAVSFSLAADPLVKIVYGRTWLEVIPLLPWAMAWGVSYSIYFAAYNLLLARNEQKKCLWLDIANLVLIALIVYGLLPYGILVYLQGTIVVQVVLFVVVYYWLQKVGGIHWQSGWALFAALSSALIAALLAMSLSKPISIWLGRELWRHLAASAMFALCYLLLLRVFFRGAFDQWLCYVPGQALIRKLLWLPVAQTH